MADANYDPNSQSTASGVTSGSALNRATGDAGSQSDPDKYPDTRAVVYNDEPVDADDDEAIARALADGRRDLIDVSGMSLERRMRFGLLTPEDDKARVEGRLGDWMATGQDDNVNRAKRSNVYESRAGSDRKRPDAEKRPDEK